MPISVMTVNNVPMHVAMAMTKLMNVCMAINAIITAIDIVVIVAVTIRP